MNPIRLLQKGEDMQRLIQLALLLAAAVAAAAAPSDGQHEGALAPQQHPVFSRLSSQIDDVRALLENRRPQAEAELARIVATLDSDLTYTRAYNHLRADVAEILLTCGEINRANEQLTRGLAASQETLTYIDAILNAEIEPPLGFSRQTIRAIRNQELAKVREILGGFEHYHMAAAESRERVKTIRLVDGEFDPVFAGFVRRHEQAIRDYGLTSHTRPYEFPTGDLVAAANVDFKVKNMLVLAYHVLKANAFIDDQRSITAVPVMISRIPEPGDHSFYEFSAVRAARSQR